MSTSKVEFVRILSVVDHNEEVSLFGEGDDEWLYQFDEASGLWKRHSPLPNWTMQGD